MSVVKTYTLTGILFEFCHLVLFLRIQKVHEMMSDTLSFVDRHFIGNDIEATVYLSVSSISILLSYSY